MGLARAGVVGRGGAAFWKMLASCQRASSWAWPKLAKGAEGGGGFWSTSNTLSAAKVARSAEDVFGMKTWVGRNFMVLGVHSLHVVVM
jgi:hypothetical protein